MISKNKAHQSTTGDEEAEDETETVEGDDTDEDEYDDDDDGSLVKEFDEGTLTGECQSEGKYLCARDIFSSLYRKIQIQNSGHGLCVKTLRASNISR